jgi:uncharacterized protein (TIGR02284 family)
MTLETKLNLSRETIDHLQELIQVNIDSRDGFNEAAAQIDDMTISSLFRQLASDRDRQAEELRTLVAVNREEPQATGSIAAAAHRLLIDLRAALGGGAATILSEAERGEDWIKEKYEKVLLETAGSAVNDVLTRQYAAVKAAHDRIRDLRDEYKAESETSN